MAEVGAAGDGGVVTNVRTWTLVIVCVATFMLMVDVTAVTIALRSVGVSLTADLSGIQWVIDAYTLTLAAFLLTAGSLADRLGRKRVFIVGLVVFTLASLACGGAPDIVVLDVSRAIQGIGAAVMFAVGPALIGQEFQGRDRGMAFGLLGGVTGLAIAFGPLIGGSLTTGASWRFIFLVNVPVGVAALAASAARLRESSAPRTHGIDWFGTVSFAVALGLVVLAFLRSETDGWTSFTVLASLVAGVALLVAFVVVEARLGEAAMFDLSLFRVPTFTGVAVATLLSNAAILSVIFLQLFYMQSVLGYSAWDTGIRFIAQTFTIFVVATLTGSLLVNRVPPGLLVGAAIAFIAAGIALADLVTPGSSWTVLLPSLLVTGIGMGLFNPPRATVTIGVVHPMRAGMASGMGESFQQVGVAIGIAAFGALFQARTVSAFVASDAGRRLGDRAADIGHSVVVHGTQGVAATVPADLASATAASAEASFVQGFTLVMTVCAVVAAAGAVIAFALIRRRDLHATALGPPPEGPGEPAVPSVGTGDANA